MAGERQRRLARRTLTVLRKKYGRREVHTERDPLEELLLEILQEGMSEKDAVAALNALTEEFVDWNELRVGSTHAIAEAMPKGVPKALKKARILRDVLARVYDKVNEMSLNFLEEASSRETARFFARVDGFPEAALARATVVRLGEETPPLTPRFVEICRRIGILTDNGDHDVMRRALDGAVPKNSMFEFHWLLGRHGRDLCVQGEPLCEECPLNKDCMYGKKKIRAQKSKSARSGAGARTSGARRKGRGSSKRSTSRSKAQARTKKSTTTTRRRKKGKKK